MDRPTCLSTFAGLGGLDLGLETAGFRVLGCVEKDPVARRSLKANRSDAWTLLEPSDIAELSHSLGPESLELVPGELDLLAGAPPCQPYSTAGQWASSARRGLRDRRGQLLFDFLDLAAAFQPKAILIENVPGFVGGPTSALKTLQTSLGELNESALASYSLHWAVLDAADFGVPQHRRRAIVVLTQDGIEFEMPTPAPPDDRRTAWDAIGSLECDDPPIATGKWADLLPSIPEGENYQWHTRRGGGAPLFGYRTRYWSFLLKLDRDRPAWTLPASPGPSTGPFHWDNRPLTISEMLRLQSFPQDWIVEGTRRERVRQVGNATPPLLGEVIGRQILQALGHSPGASLDLAIERATSTEQRVRATGVPEKYADLIGDHEDHPGTGQGPRPREQG